MNVASIRSSVQGISWPAIPGEAAATMLAVQGQLEASQWWTPAQLRDYQFRQLASLLEHARCTVPYYRERFADFPIQPGKRITLEEWVQLPVLTRQEIQAAGEQIRSEQIPASHGKLNMVRTSGSTGMPVRAWGTEVTQLFWRVFSLRDHIWHARDLTAMFVAIRPEVKLAPGTGASHSGWGPATDSIFHTGRSAVLSSRTDIAAQAVWLVGQNPVYLLSLPTNIMALAEHFRETKKFLPELREVRTYGEIATDEVRKICRDVWGVPVKDMYSATEVGYMALQCPEYGHYHVQSEAVLVEVLDSDNRPCAPGEVGRVVVTPLHNLAMPLIRYALGDYAELGEPCTCGRGLPVLKRILGRQRNMVVLPDGRKHWPSFPAELWADIGPIRQIQLVQHDLENIEARLIVERTLQPSEEGQFIQVLQERLGYPLNIHMHYVDQIERSRGGKYEDFISKIAGRPR